MNNVVYKIKRNIIPFCIAVVLLAGICGAWFFYHPSSPYHQRMVFVVSFEKIGTLKPGNRVAVRGIGCGQVLRVELANPLLELDDGGDDISYEDYAAEAENRDSHGDDEANSGESIDPREYERGDLDDSAAVDRGMLDGATNAELDWASYLNDGYSDTDAPFKDLNAGPADPDDEWDRPVKDVDLSLQDKLKNQLREWNGTHRKRPRNMRWIP